jgi:ABC-2 type transport system permease protein
MIFTIIGIELYKIFKKWRTYIGFIAIAILVSLIQIAIAVEGEGALDMMTRSIRESFIFVGNLLNGYFASYLVLNSLFVHIPFLIALVAGDLLAGEATAGTYRMLITRPISRFQIVTGKFISSLIYTFLLVFWMALLSLGVGITIFGVGELIVISSSNLIVFPRDDVFWRFLAAYGYAVLSMSVVASLAFLLSSLVENAIGPIVTTMAIIIVFIIIGALNIEFLENIRPYLFTSYMGDWRLIFADPIDSTELTKSIAVLVGHIILFYGTTFWIFRRKDILS